MNNLTITPAQININLGFIGNKSLKLQELYKNYTPKPNESGYFLYFEDYTEYAINKGVIVSTNCFESEEDFLKDLQKGV